MNKKTKAKPAIKQVVKDKFAKVNSTVRGSFDNIKHKLNSPQKVRKLTKAQKKELREQKKRAIIGIGLFFVVVSITYSTYITRIFVDTNISLVALAPQVVFAVVSLLIAFSKIYK